MSSPAVILLLSNNEDCLQRWSASLAAAPVQLVTNEQDLPDATAVDVVLTDKMLIEGLAGIHPDKLTHGEIGIIRIGVDGVADVTLPAAATDREIKLSCLLLSQIVRLRRERRENRRIRRVLSHLALSDPLTGLPNRRAWDDQLSVRIADLRNVGNLVLVVMDLDQFKQINDEQGHLTGDEVLKDTARALTASVRDGDFVARVGGDEFGILIMDCEQSRSATVVERIRRSVRVALPFDGAITLSAGFAVASDAAEAPVLFAAADQALRDAKRAGGDRTAESSPP